jgi:SAM-dependent methyltransferase
MSDPRLTTPEYWEANYTGGADAAPLQIEGFRNFASRKIIERVEKLPLTGSRVLEVGAGNSAVLTFLARQYGSRAQFVGLDYSPNGCEMLARRAAREKVSVDVIQQDLFHPDSALVGSFDVIYSLGVVEHFKDVSIALGAKKRLLSAMGRMLTVIPNMAGALGKLTQRFNRGVYDVHVPHDLSSFLAGHRQAGLEVVSSGYICSTNFGILSSCFTTPTNPGWRSYMWLSRVSKTLWFLEEKFGELPHTAWLSPYLFVESRHPQ